MFVRIIIAVGLASAAAAAEQPKPPKPAPQPQVVCSYAKPRFENGPKGRTVIIMGKVCTEVSR